MTLNPELGTAIDGQVHTNLKTKNPPSSSKGWAKSK